MRFHQGGGGVTVRGGVKWMVGHGTQGCDFVADIGDREMVGSDDLGGFY